MNGDYDYNRVMTLSTAGTPNPCVGIGILNDQMTWETYHFECSADARAFARDLIARCDSVELREQPGIPSHPKPGPHQLVDAMRAKGIDPVAEIVSLWKRDKAGRNA